MIWLIVIVFVVFFPIFYLLGCCCGNQRRRSSAATGSGNGGGGTLKSSSTKINSSQSSQRAVELRRRLSLSSSNDSTVVIAVDQGMLHAADSKRLFELFELLTEVTSMTCLLFHITTTTVAAGDAEEENIKRILKESCPAFPQHRVLFYESAIGKTAILRQIVPTIYIDSDVELLSKLRSHLKVLIAVESKEQQQQRQQQGVIIAASKQFRTIPSVSDLLDLSL